MPASEIVIASAKRTPVGSFNGAFGSTAAHELGAIAIKSALEAAKVEAGEVDEVILGQILSAAQGQDPARQAAMKDTSFPAPLPATVPGCALPVPPPSSSPPRPAASVSP